MMNAERSSNTLVLNDWFHDTSDEIALRLLATNDSMRPLCASSILFNGMGSVQCPTPMNGRDSFGCVSMEAMMPMSSGSGEFSAYFGNLIYMCMFTLTSISAGDVSASMSQDPTVYSTTSSISLGPSMGPMASLGNMPMTDMNDMTAPLDRTAQSAIPALKISTAHGDPSMPTMSGGTGAVHADQLCQNTSSSLYELHIPGNMTWTMIHLINAGASQQLAFSIDEHDLWVVSADGNYVVPHKVQVSSVPSCLSSGWLQCGNGWQTRIIC